MKFTLKKKIYLALASVVYLVLSEYGVISLGEADFNKYVEVVAFILTTVGILVEPKNISEGMNKDEEIGL